MPNNAKPLPARLLGRLFRSYLRHTTSRYLTIFGMVISGAFGRFVAAMGVPICVHLRLTLPFNHRLSRLSPSTIVHYYPLPPTTVDLGSSPSNHRPSSSVVVHHRPLRPWTPSKRINDAGHCTHLTLCLPPALKTQMFPPAAHHHHVRERERGAVFTHDVDDTRTRKGFDSRYFLGPPS